MPSIPTGRRVFLDTNVLLYAVTEHPGYGKWANVLLDRIRNKRVEEVISVIVSQQFGAGGGLHLVHKVKEGFC
jgi:predicted nucleic acid-binding protein